MELVLLRVSRDAFKALPRTGLQGAAWRTLRRRGGALGLICLICFDGFVRHSGQRAESGVQRVQDLHGGILWKCHRLRGQALLERGNRAL